MSSTQNLHIIKAYLSKGAYREALLLHSQLRCRGLSVLGIVPLILKTCASLSVINHGKALHAESIKSGVDSHVMIATSLLAMYAKCGDVLDARKVFDFMPHRNVVSWNAMISAYLRSNHISSAVALFENMPERTAVTWHEMIRGFAMIGDMTMAEKLFDEVPDKIRSVVTWTVMVDGYACNGDMMAAREFFERMTERNYFVWSVMISGYCRQGEIEQANAIFCRCPDRNLVIWNSLISGFAQNGFCEEAIEAYYKMSMEGFEPDQVTVVSVLSACSQLGLLDVGKEVHLRICELGISPNQFVLNGLVDMYAKCGDFATAKSIFEGMPQANDACWNSIISGFAIHGKCQEAVELFHEMENAGLKPDEITFLSVLSSCAHGGLVQQGLDIFSKMDKYGVTASVKHYGCVIDLLGRAGRLKEAFELVKSMPVRANATIWGSLLGACRLHSATILAEEAMDDINSIDSGSDCDSHYVVLSNIYAAQERWEKAEETRTSMIGKGFRKIPGSSKFMHSG